MIAAVLGRKDYPTDAIEDYSRLLGRAFEARGFDFTLFRLHWETEGRLGALRALWRAAAAWRGEWALVQYTSLMWSRRGFPLLLPLAFGLLRMRGVQVAVVFHDQGPFGGVRLVDRVRRACQREVMRWISRKSDAAVLTYPLEDARWLPGSQSNTVSIPIGANVPVSCAPQPSPTRTPECKTISVFAITDAGDISREVEDIVTTARLASERFGSVRLTTLGRGSKESECKIRERLEGSGVEFQALGVLPAEQVSRVLANSDVSLYVRGAISTQRGSAIASIAAGVPLVAYSGDALPVPLLDAGVIGVPFRDNRKLAEAAIAILVDDDLRSELCQRSRSAYTKHFAWEVVANRFLEVLNLA